jgi:3-oxoacid CoA-transferase subunit A
MVGGFGLSGVPFNLINALVAQNVKDLTCISNNCGKADEGVIKLIKNNQISRL